jgi:protein phosphatase
VTPAGPVVIEHVHITAVSATNRRDRNEDAIGVGGWVLQGEDVNPLAVLHLVDADFPVAVAVTDGMGGLADGDVAARLAARQLTGRWSHQPGSEVSLRNAFRLADDVVHQEAPDGEPMGCTAALLIVRCDGTAIIGNIGDVRIYRMYAGQLSQISEDDRVDDGGVVSRCIGGRHRTRTEPHELVLDVQPGDRLLLCSDGLYDVVPHERIRDVLRRETASDAVVDLMNDAKDVGEDNVTIVVVEFSASPQAPGQRSTARPARVAQPARPVAQPAPPQQQLPKQPPPPRQPPPPKQSRPPAEQQAQAQTQTQSQGRQRRVKPAVDQDGAAKAPWYQRLRSRRDR